ncbi:MAG: haloalkane dehalogenase [Candidatus Hydrogenedentota bacterium]
MSEISADDRYERKRVSVLDSDIAYVDTGSGAPVVFLHGNPTSSYLWRNVMPHVEGSSRCLAPDLIGMGQSGKNPAGEYTFSDHARYLDAWFDAVLPDEKVILVIHDWGSGLGFHWANRHRDRVQGIVYMEAIVKHIESWDDWPEGARQIFQGMRSEAGESIVLEKNVFVERILPASVVRGLTDAEMEVYRAPYTEAGESRRPTLTWPRQIPIEGEPADVVGFVNDYAAWLSSDDGLPKLYINADPGTILIGAQREFCRSWPNQEEITVKGTHFVQEDSPVEIGEAVNGFVAKVRG